MPRPTARNYHDIKRGWWNGKWYDSSWELALIVFFHDHGMELTRNTKKFEYVYRKRKYYYQPDFIDENGHYIEVKGIMDNLAKRKLEWFPYPIRVFGRDEMKPYLEYMAQKHGRNWSEKFQSIPQIT